MKLDKSQINDLLIRWIKSDAHVWGELTELQIKLLFERIVHEVSYKQLAEKYKVPTGTIHQILRAIFLKIDRILGTGLGDLLRQINDSIKSGKAIKSPRIYQMKIGEVFLN